MNQSSFLHKGLLAKLSMLLLLWMVAAITFAQITVNVQNKPLRETLKEIEKVSNYKFFYNESLPGINKNVSIRLSNADIDSVMRQLLLGTNIQYTKNDNNIIALSENGTNNFQNQPLSQSKLMKIKGRIVDEKGEAVIGASIVEKNNPSNGAISDSDGNFSLNLPSDAIIKISYIGYRTEELPIKGKSSINVILYEDAKMLDELVVVGYSVQRRESLTGSLQSLPSNKLKDITTPSVENMLTSKAPGVYVAPGSGQPGASGAVIIRGKSTVNGSTDPLWVIDGVIVGNSSGSLNPEDIETMTILKDAASTAIYGSQGANGVIVVTTKNPKADDLKVTLSAKAGVSNLVKGNLKMMNGAELYDYYSSFSNQEEIVFPRWNPDLRNSNFDWWNFASRTGVVQDYNLTLSGGSAKLRSLVSVGIYDESGAVKGYQFTRYNLLYKTDYRPTKWLTIKPFLSGSRTDIDDRQHSVAAMYSNLPWDSPYDDKGNIVPNWSPLWVNSNSTNYVYDLQWNFSKSRTYEFSGNFDFDIKFTDWLTFSSVNNIKYENDASKSYDDPRSSSAEGVNGRISEYRFDMTRLYTNQLLRFNKLIDKHSVNALLAYEYNDYRGESVTAIGTGFVPGFQILDVVSKPESTKGGISEWAVQSVFSNINYSYDDKYLAQFSLRRDGASNFGDNAKYGDFFSISGGWNIHQEDFFKSDVINQLKLRISYGSVGNRPSSLYPQYDLYAASSSVSYNELPGTLISQIGNKDLTWEKTYTTGIGIDAGFFDRFRLTIDLYDKNTSDLLYQVPVPGLTGVTRVWKNVGAVNNKGFEVLASVDAIKNKELLWTIDANIGLNRNKVTELYGQRDPKTGQVAPIILGDGIGIAGSANRILREGADADTWYIREWAGVNPENGAPQWYKTVADVNGVKTREKTSKYAEADQVEMGAYTPKFFGGFSTSIQWKRFDTQMVFGYSVGGKIYNYTRAEYDSDGAYSDRNQMKLLPSWNRWQKPGDIATHPVASYNNPSNSNKVSSRYLEDGSYLKMRSLSLGYNLTLPQYQISNLRFFITGENLFTLTGYSGVDPELPSYSGQVVGVTTTVYPSTRKFLFGVNLTF